jgi:hypothetical protein
VWLEVVIWLEKGTRAASWSAARDVTARGPTLRRTARPFFFIFGFFSPFSPFGSHFAPTSSFAYILQSGTPIDDPSSPTHYTSKHLPILTILFSFERLECAALVVPFFMSFCFFSYDPGLRLTIRFRLRVIQVSTFPSLPSFSVLNGQIDCSLFMSFVSFPFFFVHSCFCFL